MTHSARVQKLTCSFGNVAGHQSFPPSSAGVAQDPLLDTWPLPMLRIITSENSSCSRCVGMISALCWECHSSHSATLSALHAKNQKTARQDMLCESVPLMRAGKDVAQNKNTKSHCMLTLSPAGTFQFPLASPPLRFPLCDQLGLLRQSLRNPPAGCSAISIH